MTRNVKRTQKCLAVRNWRNSITFIEIKIITPGCVNTQNTILWLQIRSHWSLTVFQNQLQLCQKFSNCIHSSTNSPKNVISSQSNAALIPYAPSILISTTRQKKIVQSFHHQRSFQPNLILLLLNILSHNNLSSQSQPNINVEKPKFKPIKSADGITTAVTHEI